MSFSYKKFILLFFVLLQFSFAGCTSDTLTPKIYNEISFAQQLFPELDGISIVSIEEVYLNPSSRVPGPNDIMYRGYIELEQEKADYYRSTYTWHSTDFKPYTEYIVVNILESAVWYQSSDFNDNLLKDGLIGKIYFYNNVLWFEVMTT